MSWTAFLFGSRLDHCCFNVKYYTKTTFKDVWMSKNVMFECTDFAITSLLIVVRIRVISGTLKTQGVWAQKELIPSQINNETD